MLSTALLVGAFPQERGHAATSSDVDEPDLLVEPDSPKVDTIPLAALLPLSGVLASRGELHKFALEKAVADANRQWQEEASPWRFRLEVVDSRSDPDTALAAAMRLWDRGYRIFIASSSAEVERLQP